MKKFIIILSFLTSGSLFAGVEFDFKGRCQKANASVQDNDIEFTNLNLDIDAGQNIESKKCEIVAKFPSRRGYKLLVSTFKVEALAVVKDHGAAIMTLRHNFKGRGWRADEARVTNTGDQALVVEQTAVGSSDCEGDAVLQTEIITAGRNANLLQDSATNIIKIKYSYERCR